MWKIHDRCVYKGQGATFFGYIGKRGVYCFIGLDDGRYKQVRVSSLESV